MSNIGRGKSENSVINVLVVRQVGIDGFRKKVAVMMRLLYLSLICLLASGIALAQPAGPTEQLREALDTVLEELKNKQLDSAIRRTDIEKIIYGHFDFRVMSQRALSTNWKKASAEEKQQFVDKFSKLLFASYIRRIEAYTDEQIEYIGEKIKNGRAEVSTIIVSGDADIPIRYKMRLKGGKWLVYDVVIEEVSLIRNYRSSYRDIVKKEGIDGLLSKMDEKIAQLDAG